MQKSLRTGALTLLTLAMVANAVAAEDEPVNTGLFGGVAIKGYDTVAYFTEGKAMKGAKEFAHEWLGTPWHFANAKHRQMFIANPTKYAPQYGGYCALGVGLKGNEHAAENIDPVNAWRIIEGKLYFVYNETYVGELDGPARDQWLAAAERNWPDIKAEIKNDLSN